MNLRIIDDKLYHEYSATELDDIKHRQLEDEAIKRGQCKFATSIFEETTICKNPTRMTITKRTI